MALTVEAWQCLWVVEARGVVSGLGMRTVVTFPGIHWLSSQLSPFRIRPVQAGPWHFFVLSSHRPSLRQPAWWDRSPINTSCTSMAFVSEMWRVSVFSLEGEVGPGQGAWLLWRWVGADTPPHVAQASCLSFCNQGIQSTEQVGCLC